MNETDYELEERAAIREIDARTSRPDADKLAREDIRQREAKLTQDDIKKQIKNLQERRGKITTELTALKEGDKKKALLAEWMELNKKIVDLRKELR